MSPAPNAVFLSLARASDAVWSFGPHPSSGWLFANVDAFELTEANQFDPARVVGEKKRGVILSKGGIIRMSHPIFPTAHHPDDERLATVQYISDLCEGHGAEIKTRVAELRGDVEEMSVDLESKTCSGFDEVNQGRTIGVFGKMASAASTRNQA